VLAAAVGAKRILEVGCGLDYSAHAMPSMRNFEAPSTGKRLLDDGRLVAAIVRGELAFSAVRPVPDEIK
jgi:hypothetical protein